MGEGLEGFCAAQTRRINIPAKPDTPPLAYSL